MAKKRGTGLIEALKDLSLKQRTGEVDMGLREQSAASAPPQLRMYCSTYSSKVHQVLNLSHQEPNDA